MNKNEPTNKTMKIRDSLPFTHSYNRNKKKPTKETKKMKIRDLLIPLTLWYYLTDESVVVKFPSNCALGSSLGTLKTQRKPVT